MISRRGFTKSALAASALPLGFSIGGAQAAEFPLKWGNAMPSSHPINLRGAEAAERIKAESGGRVEVAIFPDNQLGSETVLLSQVRTGALDIFTTAGTSIGTLVPVGSIMNVAFAFPDYPAVWKAMDGDLGTHIAAALDKSGLHVLGRIWDNGFRQTTTKARQVRTPEDVKGLKIRVPASPVLVDLFKSLGASPVSMNVSDLYTALQTGVVEGQENPLSIIATRHFDEVQTYCTLTNHVWDGFIQVAGSRTWRGLPDDLKEIVTRSFDEAAVRQREDVAKANASLQDELTKKGLKFYNPDIGAFRDAVKKSGLYGQWKSGYGPEAWALLERYSGPLA